MLLGVWLLVALMPLRAWAAVEMTVAVVTGAATAGADVEAPPCHAHAAEEAPADLGHAVCAQCVLCTPMLADAAAPAAGMSPPGEAPPSEGAAPAPALAPDALFRPPRG